MADLKFAPQLPRDLTRISPPSPLTGRPGERIGAIPVEALTDAYRKENGIDAGKYLPEIDALDVYRCLDTGLEYFSPGPLAGPPAFYEELYATENPEGGYDGNWAYRHEKWEYAVARDAIARATSVLDIGCGGGDFLVLLKGLDRRLVGLETSRFGRTAASAKGLDVRDESIEKHAAANADAYDAVSAIQVLEHVNDPRAFIENCVRVLRPGGQLFASVSCRPSGYKDLNGENLHRTVRGIDWWVDLLKPDRADFGAYVRRRGFKLD